MKACRKVIILLYFILLTFYGAKFDDVVETSESSSDEVSEETESTLNNEEDQSDESNIAIKAAEDAKAAANAQQEAGQKAAYRVQKELAEKAAEAAKAAKAVWVGKEALVKQLQHELNEADVAESDAKLGLEEFEETVQSASKVAQDAKQEVTILETALRLAQTQIVNAQKVVDGEERQVSQSTHSACNSCNKPKREETSNSTEGPEPARDALEGAQQQVKLLGTALELARNEATAAQEALEGDQQQLKVKQKVVEAAGSKVKSISQQLCAAKTDLRDTKTAAQNAQSAASAAKANVGRSKRKISKRNSRT